jgi:hypothetical protein
LLSAAAHDWCLGSLHRNECLVYDFYTPLGPDRL